MLAENSKYVEGTEQRYSVTTEGRVYRHSYVDTAGALLKGRWNKPVSNRYGYQMISILGKYHALHRVIAKAFIPNPENKPEINHVDGIKDNNVISNLEWCTRSENAQHAVDTGLMPMHSGERCKSAKLTDAQVSDIRKRYSAGGVSQKQLGHEFDTHPSNISYICSGKSRNKG
jgi:hypothetical protein